MRNDVGFVFYLANIVRPLLAFVLGLMIVSGIGILAVERTASTTLTDDGFYHRVLAENDAYNRLYDEALRDDETRRMVSEKLRGALPDPDLVTYEELTAFLRAAAPPEYLRRQAEPAISAALDYVNGDVEELRIYVDLGPALDRAAPAVVSYVQGRIDRTPEGEADVPGCGPESLERMRERVAAMNREIEARRAPRSIPSLKSLTQSCRELIFDAAYGTYLAGDGGASGLDSRMVKGLQDRREEIRAAIVAGDAKEALKASVPAIVPPILEDEISKFRATYLDDDRIELIDLAAPGEAEAAEIRADVERFRQSFLEWRSRVRLSAAFLLLGGIALTFLIYLPDWKVGLRRLGTRLAVVGALGFIGVAFVVARVLEAQLPGILENALITSVEGFPPSLAALIGDLAGSSAGQLAEGTRWVFLALLAVGAAALLGLCLPRLVRWFRGRSAPG